MLITNRFPQDSNQKTGRVRSKSMFSDNDELASLVARFIKAGKFIILTDIDGLYTGNPEDENTEIIKNVKVDQNVEQYIQELDKGEAERRGAWAPN